MHRDQATRCYVLALVIADALLLGAAFVGAALLRGTVDILPVQPYFDLGRYTVVAAAVIPGLLGILWLRGAYNRHNLLSGPDEYARILSACTYGTLLVVGVSYVYGSLPLVSRGWLLLFWLLAIGLVGTGRFVLRRVAQHLRRRGHFIRRVLIAGANDQGMTIAEQLHSPAGQGTEVVGFVDDYVGVGSQLTLNRGYGIAGRRFPVLGHPRDTQAVAAETRADLLVVVPAALSWESQQLLVQLAESEARRLEIRLAPTDYDLNAAQLQPAPLGFVPLVRVQPARLLGVDALLRGVVDVGLAAATLTILLPALSVVVAAAWLRGVRPLLVSRPVLGQGGPPVTLWLLNPDVSEGLVLRGVPALVAVLRGQLALVGPRPLPLEKAASCRRWSRLLLSVKPGLTGPWRLSRPDASDEERLLADVWWVRNWSIWQHLFVLVQSLRSMWGGMQGRREVQRWEVARYRRARASRDPASFPAEV
jgi:lipopolysaccharide/colanic/teichoic acid biosynthesis glycosyltransferase